MIRYRGIAYFPLLLMLPLVVQPAIGEESSARYHYSDEWTLVSAPPPAGPYRSVNIDPRVPGVGAVAPAQMPMNLRPPQSASEIPGDPAIAEAPVDQPLEAAAPLPEDAMEQPPAAGIAVPLPEMVAPADAVLDALQPYPGSRLPAPGYYGRTMPPPPAFNHPAPMRYPRQAGYPGYRNMPPFGYYSPPMRLQEPEVPPPPVYEQQQGYGGLR
jgi:hypothetical protein